MIKSVLAQSGETENKGVFVSLLILVCVHCENFSFFACMLSVMLCVFASLYMPLKRRQDLRYKGTGIKMLDCESMLESFSVLIGGF